MSGKLNNWCFGIRLPNGDHSGCTCDCPTCKTTACKLAALEAAMMVDDTILAGEMYTAYCAAVGGKAYNGDPLPDWPTLCDDPSKQKIVAGWMAAANAAHEMRPQRKHRALTPAEKAKGRSESYWSMSSEDQWAEDKRLGILDWDGS